jgi:hypothetical protein
MKWATGSELGTIRPACIWLIRRFIDPHAEFVFLPKNSLLADAAEIGARTFHGRDVGDYPTTATRTAFAALMDGHGLWGRDAALDYMGRMLDKPPAGGNSAPELIGVRALIHGFQDSVPNDHQKLVHLIPMYEALYRYCARKVAGKE